MNNLEFALKMKNKRLASGLSQTNVLQAVFRKENLQVLPMYQDIVSTALRTEKPMPARKHKILSCVV